MDTIFIQFGRFATATMIIPIVVAIWQRKYLVFPLRIYLYYRILAFLFNVLQQTFIWFALNDYEKIRPLVEFLEISDTNFTAILFQLNNVFFLGWFYIVLLPTRYTSWIKWTAILLFFSMVINYLWIEGYKVYGVFNPNANAFFTVGVALIYLRFIYHSQLALPLKKNPYFWLSIALILPYLAGFFLFLTGEASYEENYPLFMANMMLKNAFLVIGQFLMAIGFYNARYAKFVPIPGNAED